MVTGQRFGGLLRVAVLALACMSAALPSPAGVQTPCSETINKYCKDVVPGGGRIMKCLDDHLDDQSIACKDWVDDQQKSLQELIAVCPEEIATLCKSAPPNKVSIYYCLLDNYVALKIDCRSKMREIRDRLK